MAPLNVVIYTSMYDTGGQGWKMKRALERYYPSEFIVRSIHTHDADFRFPTDMKYRPNEAYEAFAHADIIHMRNGIEGVKRLLSTRDPKRPFGIVVHHHGTLFRQYHRALYEEAKSVGAIQIASTLDLTLLEPNVEWLPAPFDLVELASYRSAVRANGPIRIAHAPTNRKVKSTERIMAAVVNLKKAGYSLTFDLIERQPWVEVLRRKGLADIVVDQLELGIGNNALEAFGMSIPVISGVRDPAVRDEMVRKWYALPFYEANAANLEERLAHLIRNSGLRAQWGSSGFDYLLTFHEESKVAAQLATVYRRAMEASGLVKELSNATS